MSWDFMVTKRRNRSQPADTLMECVVARFNARVALLSVCMNSCTTMNALSIYTLNEAFFTCSCLGVPDKFQQCFDGSDGDRDIGVLGDNLREFLRVIDIRND